MFILKKETFEKCHTVVDMDVMLTNACSSFYNSCAIKTANKF